MLLEEATMIDDKPADVVWVWIWIWSLLATQGGMDGCINHESKSQFYSEAAAFS